MTDNVFAYNLDGRDFIRISISELRKYASKKKTMLIPENTETAAESRTKKVRKLENSQRKSDQAVENKDKKERKKTKQVPVPTEYAHYVMNLPHAAIEFLGKSFF